MWSARKRYRAKTDDREDSPNAGPSIHKSDEDLLEMELKKTLKPGQKRAQAKQTNPRPHHLPKQVIWWSF